MYKANRDGACVYHPLGLRVQNCVDMVSIPPGRPCTVCNAYRLSMNFSYALLESTSTGASIVVKRKEPHLRSSENDVCAASAA